MNSWLESDSPYLQEEAQRIRAAHSLLPIGTLMSVSAFDLHQLVPHLVPALIPPPANVPTLPVQAPDAIPGATVPADTAPELNTPPQPLNPAQAPSVTSPAPTPALQPEPTSTTHNVSTHAEPADHLAAISTSLPNEGEAGPGPTTLGIYVRQLGHAGYADV